MWKEIQKTPPFFLLFIIKRQKYHILITDYIKIWEVYYSEDEFTTRLEESNFGLEMDTSELLSKGLQILQRPSELKNIKLSVNGQKLIAAMTMLFGFPLKLVVNLQEGSQELFFQKVTQPALKTIQDLRCSEKKLRELLAIKDDEIEEYKSFGGKIRYTAIPPYNNEAHMKKHCMYNDNFGDAELPPGVLERIVDVPRVNHKIKEETTDTKVSVKLEPPSQEISTLDISTTTNNIKKENIKMELKPARKRKLNI